jgi:hypothetical protein
MMQQVVLYAHLLGYLGGFLFTNPGIDRGYEMPPNEPTLSSFTKARKTFGDRLDSKQEGGDRVDADHSASLDILFIWRKQNRVSSLRASLPGVSVNLIC